MWQLIVRRVCAAVGMAIVAGATFAQESPRVVAVNYALAYFAERLLGDQGTVVFPVPEDTDPSFWRPSIADISQIQSADLILLNGAGFATWVDRVSLPRSKVVDTSKAVKDQFILTQSITHSHGDGGEHSHEGLASYTWLDPMIATVQAEAIASALTRRGLVSATEVEARLVALRSDFEQLDAEVEANLEGIEGVAIIATHPRYQYFARRYGLSMTSLEWDAGKMPSASELSDLAARVETTGARVLLWEAAPPEAAKEAVAALGLSSATFPPLAHQDDGRSFLDTVTTAAAAIAAAARQAPAE